MTQQMCMLPLLESDTWMTMLVVTLTFCAALLLVAMVTRCIFKRHEEELDGGFGMKVRIFRDEKQLVAFTNHAFDSLSTADAHIILKKVNDNSVSAEELFGRDNKAFVRDEDIPCNAIKGSPSTSKQALNKDNSLLASRDQEFFRSKGDKMPTRWHHGSFLSTQISGEMCEQLSNQRAALVPKQVSGLMTKNMACADGTDSTYL